MNSIRLEYMAYNDIKLYAYPFEPISSSSSMLLNTFPIK